MLKSPTQAHIWSCRKIIRFRSGTHIYIYRVEKKCIQKHTHFLPLPFPPTTSTPPPPHLPPPPVWGRGGEGVRGYRGRRKMFKNLQKKNASKNIPISYPPPPPWKIVFQLNSDPHLIQKGKNRKNHLLNFKYHATQAFLLFLLKIVEHCQGHQTSKECFTQHMQFVEHMLLTLRLLLLAHLVLSFMEVM